jgi:hypothetical protein
LQRLGKSLMLPVACLPVWLNWEKASWEWAL